MLTNEQKYDFLNTLFERIPEDASNEELQKEIREILMADTVNGKLYKFRAVNEYSLDNLRQGTLYCALPSQFNDPFDCRVGLDVLSLTNAKVECEMEPLRKNFSRFVQLIEGTVSLDDCSEDEKDIFSKWKESRKLCGLLEKCRREDISDTEIEQIIINDLEIIQALFSGSSDVFIRNQVEAFIKMFPEIKQSMSEDELHDFLEGQYSIDRLAQRMDIDEDVDQIALVKRTSVRYSPENVELANAMEEFYIETEKRIGESIDRLYRVGSLCTDYKNRLMWSHYADSHKGFCVEYDFSSICEEVEKIFLLPVVYAKKRVMFPWEVLMVEDKESKEIKNKAARTELLSLLTKDDVWEYENEWRIITLNQYGIVNIKMPPISCIYLGAHCSEENKQVLIEIAKERNIPIKQMSVDRGEYMLHADEL